MNIPGYSDPEFLSPVHGPLEEGDSRVRGLVNFAFQWGVPQIASDDDIYQSRGIVCRTTNTGSDRSKELFIRLPENDEFLYYRTHEGRVNRYGVLLIARDEVETWALVSHSLGHILTRSKKDGSKIVEGALSRKEAQKMMSVTANLGGKVIIEGLYS